MVDADSQMATSTDDSQIGAELVDSRICGLWSVRRRPVVKIFRLFGKESYQHDYGVSMRGMLFVALRMRPKANTLCMSPHLVLVTVRPRVLSLGILKRIRPLTNSDDVHCAGAALCLVLAPAASERGCKNPGNCFNQLWFSM